ncbi:MAG TPA: chloride channel protein, partial [Thauera aminoaromatica]|nr:chloride channel protein [Thauera aminoaromatica]
MSPERNPAAPAQADGARPAAPPPEPPDSPIEPPGSAVAPRTAPRGRPFARLLRGGRRYALPWLSLRRWRVRLLLVGAALLAGLVAI